MLRAHLSPVERLCEARLTKRSTSEVRLGTTVVSISLTGKPKNFLSGMVCLARSMAGHYASQPRKGKAETACVRTCAPIGRASVETLKERQKSAYV